MSLYLIAEIGINHNGDIEIAKKLIDAAHKAGFDAVKFQKRAIDKVYTREFLDSPRESPWGKTQRDQKEGLEFSLEEYREIDRYCKGLGIAWSASAWDIDSQRFLQQFDLPFNKVASAMLGHWPLLREIASEKRKTYISTGMSTLEDIDKVVELFEKAGCSYELMHCNSTYPMQESEANLLCIPMLRRRYGCDVGYSGHERGLAPTLAAVALGACVVERHFTLNRNLPGTDHQLSLDTAQFKILVAMIREVEQALSITKKHVFPQERMVEIGRAHV